MFVKYIIKVFLYLVLAVMTLIHWFLKIPMMLGNILLYFLYSSRRVNGIYFCLWPKHFLLDD